MTNLKLNLKHLRYFWSVASHGTIARAAETLHLTPQTISDQLRDLEEQVGAKLFSREGRNLVLTETGRLVFVLRGRDVPAGPGAAGRAFR